MVILILIAIIVVIVACTISINDKLEKDEKKNLENEMNNYGLNDEEKKLVRERKYEPNQFEEEDLEEDDYYYEDD